MGWNPANWAIVNQLQGQPNYRPASESGFVNGKSGGGGGGGGGGGYVPPNAAPPAPRTKTTSPTTTSRTSSVASSPKVDANALALLDQSINNINSGIGRLDTQYNAGVGNINADAASALAKLLGGQQIAETDYKGNVAGQKTGYVGSKNKILSQSGTALSGLLRLLGSRGAGGGTAYREAAPGAVARDATLQRNEVSDVFGANMQKLDTGWNRYMNDYENSKNDIGTQQSRNIQSLKSTIDNNRATLLNQLAGLQAQRSAAAGGTGIQNAAAAQPFYDQANGLLNALASVQTAPINYTPLNYTAPSVDKYTVNPTAAPVLGGGRGSDYFSPVFGGLLNAGKKEQPLGV